MNEGNKSRASFYLILFILFLSFSVTGYYLSNSGYGKSGEIKKHLNPIVDSFNNLSNVKNNDNIKAKINTDRIEVTYKEDKKKIYTFEFKETADMKLLDFQYDISDSTNGQKIAEYMLDAISITKSHQEGELFNNFIYNNLYKTTIDNGANLSVKNEVIHLIINIDADFLENIKDINFDEIVAKFITIDDLENLIDSLNKRNNFNYYKGNITLDIYEKNDNYEIYCSNKDENMSDIYESIMSSISILNTSIYDKILNSNFNFYEDIETDEYKIEVNPEIDRTQVATQDKYLMKATIKK